MQRPNEKIEESLNSLGIFTGDDACLNPGKNTIGVTVEILVNPEGFTPPEFRIATVSKRGARIEYGNWQVLQRGEQHILAFDAFMAIPDGQTPVIQDAPLSVAMSYMDLCWNVGVEEKPEKAPELPFELAPQTVYVDLGWYLPSRFVDQLVDSMGKLNDTFMDGALSDAVIYGVIKR